jgi:diketogulonate reductase-like aldo/keto reductase
VVPFILYLQVSRKRISAMTPKIPSFPFPGKSIPSLAFGTGTAWSKSSPDAPLDRALVDSIKSALSIGYRHIDCAEVYGNETEVGIAIKESGVPRDELFITTKVYSLSICKRSMD